MEKQNLPAGNYTAIVVGARVEHYPSGSYIVQLLLSVTQGELKYSKCCKNMFYQDTPEQLALARSHFARIGGKLGDRTTVDTVIDYNTCRGVCLRGVLLFSFKGIFSSGFMPGLFYSSEKRKIFQQDIHQKPL